VFVAKTGYHIEQGDEAETGEHETGAAPGRGSERASV
jgi:hypothetical protein